MALFQIHEILDIILMTLAVGFIFKDMIPQQLFTRYRSESHSSQAYDPLVHYQNMRPKAARFLGTWDEWKWAMISVAPGIILHEFGHKFVALAMGLTATFQASYTFLAIGVILKLLSFPFLIIVPAYVAIAGQATALQSLLVAFAGPAVNGLIWLICKYAINPRKLSRNGQIVHVITQRMNGFMFLFNLIPIPFFDGSTVLLNLIHILTSS